MVFMKGADYGKNELIGKSGNGNPIKRAR